MFLVPVDSSSIGKGQENKAAKFSECLTLFLKKIQGKADRFTAQKDTYL